MKNNKRFLFKPSIRMMVPSFVAPEFLDSLSGKTANIYKQQFSPKFPHQKRTDKKSDQLAGRFFISTKEPMRNAPSHRLRLASRLLSAVQLVRHD